MTKVIFKIVRVAGDYTTQSSLISVLGLDIHFWLTVITVFVLLYSSLSKKHCRFFEVLKQTMLGIAMPLAIIVLINPRLIIDIKDSWYHCVNLSTIIINILLIVAPLYLVIIGNTKFELSKFWKAICGYICISSLTMVLALIFNTNLSGLLAMPNLLIIVQIKIAFPWHLLIVIPAFLVISFGLYSLCWYISKLLTKNNPPHEELQKQEYFELYSFATKSIACMQGFLIMIILAVLVYNPRMGTLLGLICLIPIIMTIFCILSVFEMDKLAKENNEEIFEENNPRAKNFLTYSFIGNPLFGIVTLKQYRNERAAIQDRKIREEKKIQREQKKLQEKNK